MLLNSLRGLGCTNLVTHYWDILKRKMGHHQMETNDSKVGDFLHHVYAEKLNEQRFAAAWKLGGLGVPRVSTSAGGASTHGTYRWFAPNDSRCTLRVF